MTRQPSHGDLASALRSERVGVQALMEVLEAERQALASGDADRLTDTAPRKRELLLHIAHLGEQRNRLLERCGVTADRRGMERLLEANAHAGDCRGEWDALLEMSQKAHRLNQENGAYIEAGMRANQQALSVLTSAAASASGTYGPMGRSVSAFSSRTYASA
jgi:flagella synthesis protein FlgN